MICFIGTLSRGRQHQWTFRQMPSVQLACTSPTAPSLRLVETMLLVLVEITLLPVPLPHMIRHTKIMVVHEQSVSSARAPATAALRNAFGMTVQTGSRWPSPVGILVQNPLPTAQSF